MSLDTLLPPTTANGLTSIPNLDFTMQPMSSRFIHVFQRPAAANEPSVDPITNVPLRAAPISLSFHQWHNPNPHDFNQEVPTQRENDFNR
jgi:hypothetical protein